jgi:lipopolysaccharide export system protein LptA
MNGLLKNKKKPISESKMTGKIAILREMGGSKNRNLKITRLFLLLFVIVNFFGMSQNPLVAKGKQTKINIENSDSSVVKSSNPDVYVLYGNVVFRHDSVYMYSDSAYLNSLTNSLDAFGNVRIEQGDTLSMYGDYLNYDGDAKLAKMRENVRMENKSVTLFTDNVDYNRNTNIAYYFNGGMLVDSLNELTSIYGQYSPDTKMAFFKENVTLTNPQFKLTSDTLNYHTDRKIADIISPTVIESDSGIVYTDRGWYNTDLEESMLYDRSLVISKDKTKTMTADSIFYNKSGNYVEAFGNMLLNDTVKKMILTGNYGYYDELTKFAFATDSAQVIEFSRGDSTFCHADTLQMETIGEEREVKAFHGVRFYRTDLQGVCDSLQFNTVDSILRLYKNPILWNTNYQINGDTIKILFNDSTVERVYVLNYAFALEEVDTTYFNQLKGRSLTAYFVGGEMTKVDVDGNTETIYYPMDDQDASYMGRFKAESSFMSIDIRNRQPVRIVWYPQPTSETIPIPDLNPENKYLKGFTNYNYLRPKNRDDIFTKTQMKTEDVPQPRKARVSSRSSSY